MSNAVVHERLRLLDELRQIVAAMRNLAYAELQRLRRAIEAQRQAEQVVLRALADVVGRGGETPPEGPPPMVLVIGAERGFCGGFNERLADAMEQRGQSERPIHWMLASARLLQRSVPGQPDVASLPGCAASEESAVRVDAWVRHVLAKRQDGVFPGTLRVMHHGEQGIVMRRLLPFPELPARTPGPRPLRQLNRHRLLPTLLAEMLRVSLLGALFQSLQQENEWRLMQMQRADDHLDEQVRRLRGRYFRLRQSEITSELETLVSSFDAGGGR